MVQGTLILPFSSSSVFIQNNQKNSFQTMTIPVRKFTFENVDRHQLKQALTIRSELSEALSNHIWQWISEAQASHEAVAEPSTRQVPNLKSFGRMKMRKAFHPQSLIQIQPEASNIQIVGRAWRKARRTVRIGLLSKIRRTKTNIEPVSAKTLLKYNLDLSTAKRLSEGERAALSELRYYDLRANVYLLPNHRATERLPISNGRRISVLKKPCFGSNKTLLDLLQFLSVDVDGRDLQKRFQNLTVQEIADRIKANYDRLPLKPDIIIASGSLLSFHFHWSLKTDRISQQLDSRGKQIDPRLEMAKVIQRALVELLEGDPHAIGINRQWRYPGTLNCKGHSSESRQSGYCEGSRTLEEARRSPRYTLDELYKAYVPADSVTDDLVGDDDANVDTSPIRKLSPMEQIDLGWEEKFEDIIGASRMTGLSGTEIHNVKVVFRHIHQFRHRPDAITFLKDGILREIRGKSRPYPPFYKALDKLNQLAVEPIIQKSAAAKWRSNSKLSRATEYRLTDHGRKIFQSDPRDAVDVHAVLETLYVKGERHNGLYQNAIVLFRSGWAKPKIYKILYDKNKRSSEGIHACAFDESDIRRQIDRAEDFVKNMKKKK
ncbi:MAG: hypothetical protein K2X47_12225 [Bdellovibrionales bacterium]|nr:hypothetical protein [Bdellovibrionales bacterium]